MSLVTTSGTIATAPLRQRPVFLFVNVLCVSMFLGVGGGGGMEKHIRHIEHHTEPETLTHRVLYIIHKATIVAMQSLRDEWADYGVRIVYHDAVPVKDQLTVTLSQPPWTPWE